MLSINKASSFYYIYNKLFPHEYASNENNWSIKPYFLSIYNGFYKEEKNKYQHLKIFIDGVFYNRNLKSEIFNNFSTCQKVYMGFLKLYNVYKWKKAKYYDIDYDFHGNLFKNQNKKYLIEILENNKIYVFKIHDLLNIIRHNLSNIFMPEYLVFFQEPKQIKNPYTNIPFNNSTLYNIYFFLKKLSYFPYQDLFEKFFKSHFDIKLYGIHYDHEIREESIKNYLKNLTVQEYFEGIKKMCKEYSIILDKKKWLHSLFPKKIFVEAYKPFFIVYIFSKLSLSNIKYNFYKHYLLVKLKQFIKVNYNFGRQYIKIINKSDFINGEFLSRKVKKIFYHTEYVPLKDLMKKKRKITSNFFDVEQEEILHDISLQQINISSSAPDSEIYRRQVSEDNDIMYDYNSDYYSETESDTESDTNSQNSLLDYRIHSINEANQTTQTTGTNNNQEFIIYDERDLLLEGESNTNSVESIIDYETELLEEGEVNDNSIETIHDSFNPLDNLQQENPDYTDTSLLTGLNHLNFDISNNENN